MPVPALIWSMIALAGPAKSAVCDPSCLGVTPRVVKACVNKLTRDYGDNGLLQRVPDIIAGTVVQRETTPTTRMSGQIPLWPVDILDQTAFQVNQVG